MLGDVGGSVLHHPDAQTAAEKHPLLVDFEGRSRLTVSIQGWGFIRLVKESELGDHAPALLDF